MINVRFKSVRFDTNLHAHVQASLQNVLQDLTSAVQSQLCPMTFSNQSVISAHFDTAHAQSNNRAPAPPRPEHPDAKHPCEVCGRKFTQSCQMRVHMRTVHGVGDAKNFQCDVCSKAFNKKSNLKQHLATVHRLGDVSTFKCDVCTKVFTKCTQKGNLKKHLSAVHALGDVITFQCDLCSKVFKHKSGLKKHLTTDMHQQRQKSTVNTSTVK